MQHPAWPQTAPPPAGTTGAPTGPPGSVPPHHYPPHHPQQQGYYPPPTQGGRGKSETHPQHGYSHGAPPPPQGYGGYPPHPSQGQQPPPPGYYGSQHPPHGQQQWGMHPSYGGAPPPPRSSNGSAWEQSHHQPQQSNTQSRHPESSSHPSEAQGYHPPPSHHGQHPHYSHHGPPPSEAQDPHSNGAPRAPYRPPPSQPSSQSSQHSQSSRNSHHSAPAPQPRADHSAPPPQDSNSNQKAPPLTSAHRMPPNHEASAQHPSRMPSQSSQQPGPHGYPRPPPPPPPSHHTPNIHPSFSTASNRTSNTVTTTHKATQPPHTPGALSMAASTATAYTEDEKGRGSYKCGRCGVPKKGHVCPYQPKVKRRPDEPVPEMKCVSTQVEMDEFMTLRRLNIEIQGYPESYAAEPMDMVGAEIGQHRPSNMGDLANPDHPSMESGSDTRTAPTGSGSHHAGPPTSLPSLTSMQSQPAPGAPPSVKVDSSSSEPAVNGPLVNAGENSKVEGGESNNAAGSIETATQQTTNDIATEATSNEIATQTKSNADETLTQPDAVISETKSGTAASSSPPVDKESITDTGPTADTPIKKGDESQLEATTTEKSDTMPSVKNEEAETMVEAPPPEQLSESKKREAEKISTSEGVEASEADSNKKSRT